MTTPQVRDAATPPVRFVETLGFRTVEASPERVVIELEIDDRHRSPRGLMHGGALLALADVAATALAMRSNSAEAGGDGKPMAVIDVHASILANQPEGQVRAEARIVRRGRRVTVVRVSVLGADDRLLAELTSTSVPV
ncbi:MAG: hotdog fold thioesterase [Dehalococcoidia bacterium]